MICDGQNWTSSNEQIYKHAWLPSFVPLWWECATDSSPSNNMMKVDDWFDEYPMYTTSDHVETILSHQKNDRRAELKEIITSNCTILWLCWAIRQSTFWLRFSCKTRKRIARGCKFTSTSYKRTNVLPKSHNLLWCSTSQIDKRL